MWCVYVFFFNKEATTEIYPYDTLFPYTTLFREDDPARPRGRQARPAPRPQPDARRGREEAPRASRQTWLHRCRCQCVARLRPDRGRSEEHTSEHQTLMRVSYSVFCLEYTKKSQRSFYINAMMKEMKTS